MSTCLPWGRIGRRITQSISEISLTCACFIAISSKLQDWKPRGEMAEHWIKSQGFGSRVREDLSGRLTESHDRQKMKTGKDPEGKKYLSI